MAIDSRRDVRALPGPHKYPTLRSQIPGGVPRREVKFELTVLLIGMLCLLLYVQISQPAHVNVRYILTYTMHFSVLLAYVHDSPRGIVGE